MSDTQDCIINFDAKVIESITKTTQDKKKLLARERDRERERSRYLKCCSTYQPIATITCGTLQLRFCMLTHASGKFNF